MALGLPKLSIENMLSTISTPAPVPSVSTGFPTLPMGVPAPPSQTGTPTGGFTGQTGSGFGLSAYGFQGRSGTSGTKGSAPYGFQPEMWRALSAANAAMVKAGLPAFRITDGWRSYAAQVDVKRRKGNLAATPGRSVHGIGLAADLQLNSRQQKWLEQNGAKFGLMRLPSESWHWQLSPNLAGRRAQPTTRAAQPAATRPATQRGITLGRLSVMR